MFALCQIASKIIFEIFTVLFTLYLSLALFCSRNAVSVKILALPELVFVLVVMLGCVELIFM